MGLRFYQASGIAFGALFVSGCVAGKLPVQPDEGVLLAIDATSARFPVMLSRVPTSDKGRAVSTSGGSSHGFSQFDFKPATYTAGSNDQAGRSTAEQIARWVQAEDRWLQIERAEYQIHHGSGYGSVSQGKRLTLEGSVHR